VAASTKKDEREAATARVCDLLAFAEEAALEGKENAAARYLQRAERAAWDSGYLWLLDLVWHHSPVGRQLLA
jgi:hypothetical protein